MSRIGAIWGAVAATAWVAIAVVLGGGAFSSARPPIGPSGPSPQCLPSTIHHTARLSGSGIEVSPEPGSVAASPNAQISMLGVPVGDIGSVRVWGSRSGSHPGRLLGYSQQDGASFVPERPFLPGETVTVLATVKTPGGSRPANFSFRTDTPRSTDGLPGFPHPPIQPGAVQSFRSRSDLHPPTVTVTTSSPATAAGDLLITPAAGPSQYGPMILDRQGRLVWFDPLAFGQVAADLKVQRYQGQQVLTWWQGRLLVPGFGEGYEVIANRSYQTLARVGAGNGYSADLHDFQLAPDGSALIEAYNSIRCDLTSLGGPRNAALLDTLVQDVDVATGLVRSEWHGLDHVSVKDSLLPVVTKPLIPWDYLHVNSIDRLPNGDLLISARNTSAVYRLQAGSGIVVWQLGGKNPSFDMRSGTDIAWQHDARLQPDGSFTLFDDQTRPGNYPVSRGVVLRVDTANQAASFVTSYKHPTPIVAGSQGSMQRLPNGDLLLGWGQSPYISEFAPNGTLLFDAHLPLTAGSYRAESFSWQGNPTDAPALSAAIINGQATAVYVSWNGSTSVSSWRILAGKSPQTLSEVTTVPRSDFETAVLLAQAEPYVEAQARDARGVALASSPAIAPTPSPPPPAG